MCKLPVAFRTSAFILLESVRGDKVGMKMCSVVVASGTQMTLVQKDEIMGEDMRVQTALVDIRARTFGACVLVTIKGRGYVDHLQPTCYTAAL